MYRKIFAAILALMVFAAAAYAQDIKVGSFTLTVPDSFETGEVSKADIEEGTTAYYRSDETLLDFDLYHFAKDKPFAEFMKDHAEGKPVTENEVNGIKVLSFRDVHEFEDTKYPVMICYFEDEEGYEGIVFWLDGDSAEAEAQAILHSLRK